MTVVNPQSVVNSEMPGVNLMVVTYGIQMAIMFVIIILQYTN